MTIEDRDDPLIENSSPDAVIDPRKGVQSVEIGLRVAAALATASGPQALRDIARATGLASAAAHRYLVSLVRAGLVVQGPDGRYDLGGLALRLGFSALGRLDGFRTVEAHLHAFVNVTGCTAMMTVWSEQGPIVVRWIHGLQPVFTTISLGSVMPLSTSATGAIYLAWLHPGLLRHQGPPLRAMETARIAEIKRRGVALITGDLVPGLNAAAVPVFDGSGALFAVFTAVSAGASLDAPAIQILTTYAADASADLGWSSPSPP